MLFSCYSYWHFMIIDDITIKVKAGKGGNGLAAFNKNKMTLGPSGGSGGNGGSIYILGVSDLGALNRLRNKKVFKAADGHNGKHQLNDGNDGDDLIIEVPTGTVIHNLATNTDHEIISVNEKFLVARGGHGGKGNFHFRGPHNTSPRQFQDGLPGEEFRLRLELKMIADVGLIGLPNVGKSSLLNTLTKAKSKVANYNFTTLEPHLGVYYGVILADIPGLIEGASTGKGLGIKFLRHIERTKVVFHLISADSEDPVREYKVIRNELATYSKSLSKKEEYVFLSKADLVTEAVTDKKIAQLRKLNPNSYPLSIADETTLGLIKKTLNSIAESKQKLSK